jgi:3-oxoacyl-[acyl-carrier-protein] synthase II
MRRVVITSFGIISSLGRSAEEIAENIRADRTFFSRASFRPDTAVCPANDNGLREIIGRNKNIRYLNRGALFGAAAARLVIDSVVSSLGADTLTGTGLFAGVGPNFESDKSGARQALWILKELPNTLSSFISQTLGIRGENLAITTACAASLQAIGEAFRRIKYGQLDTALAGGGDSRISPEGLSAYADAGALWHGDDPVTGYAPFNSRRNGFVPGEGGAFLFLEELEHARARGAAIIAEILGYGSSLDGTGMTAPDRAGKALERSIRSALDEGDLSPDSIDLISAHGTGTELNDLIEAQVLARIFPQSTRVTALKSWIGHLSAACGAAELSILLSCMAHHIIPRIRNLDTPCIDGLSFVRENIPFDSDRFIINNCGFGGQNATLAVKRWE